MNAEQIPTRVAPIFNTVFSKYCSQTAGKNRKIYFFPTTVLLLLNPSTTFLIKKEHFIEILWKTAHDFEIYIYKYPFLYKKKCAILLLSK